MRKFIEFLFPGTPAKMTGKQQSKKKSEGTEPMRVVCIIMAIVIFITLAVMNVFSIMGVMKTIYVWALLNSDITDEETGMNRLHSDSNVQKLNKSLDKETMYSTVYLILAGFGFQLSCASVVLLYGVFKNKVQALYAWIIFSYTNIFCLATLLFFLNKCAKVLDNAPLLDTGLELIFAAIVFYNVIVFFHARTLSKKEVKIVVKAYGGYRHTIRPVQQLPEKTGPLDTSDNCIV